MRQKWLLQQKGNLKKKEINCHWNSKWIINWNWKSCSLSRMKNGVKIHVEWTSFGLCWWNFMDRWILYCKLLDIFSRLLSFKISIVCCLLRLLRPILPPAVDSSSSGMNACRIYIFFQGCWLVFLLVRCLYMTKTYSSSLYVFSLTKLAWWRMALPDLILSVAPIRRSAFGYLRILPEFFATISGHPE